MVYQLKSYLSFLLKSTNQHGVHSPFVYDLVTSCFYDKTNYAEYKQLKAYRNRLLNAKEEIEITDFGAGSRVFTSNCRKISAIAKNAGITAQRQKLLFRLARYFSSENILELGTSLGIATSALASANPSGAITTVEGCPNTSKVAQDEFDHFKLKNINLITSSFQDFFSNRSSEKYGLAYIDGSHSKEATLSSFNALLQHTTNNSVLIFDDIYWSAQMTEAWREIIRHPEITVSIDTFYWGLIFFRKEQKKQHFTIRL